MQNVIIRHNGARFAGQKEDTIEKLHEMLETHPLDKTRSFSCTIPNYSKYGLPKGIWRQFGGNFITYSHGFDVFAREGSSEEKKLSRLVSKNRSTKYVDRD